MANEGARKLNQEAQERVFGSNVASVTANTTGDDSKGGVLAFQTKEDASPETLARAFEQFAADAIGNNDSDELFNAALEFAIKMNLNSGTMRNILTAAFAFKKIKAKVVQVWARDGATALGEVEDPTAKDTLVKIDLDDYAKHAEGWEFARYAAEASEWAKRFNDEFFSGRLPSPTISFDFDQKRILGTYRLGRDGLALQHRINLNALHLERSRPDRLETLLHEMLHEWEEVERGRKVGGSYHTRAFREKALEFGIPCTEGGVSLPVDPDGRFAKFIAQFGVSLDEAETPTQAPPSTKRRKAPALHNWNCGCTSVWASRGIDVQGICEKCSQRWQRTTGR